MKKISILSIIIIILSTFFIQTSSATMIENNINSETVDLMTQQNSTRASTTPAGEQSNISGKTFYIKNMLTGQYLDIAGGVAANGTNVQQYKFNGTDAQKWYAYYNSDGTYTFFTPLGNDGTYRYALDISNGSGNNYANVQIHGVNFTDSQKFSLAVTNLQTYVLFTKVSNYQKAVVLNGPTYNQGGNIDQYTFQAHYNECWILEPVNYYPTLGVSYARTNYAQYVPTYPNLTDFNEETADCANFVSQCMLASGIHYKDNRKVYRNNGDYSQPTNVTQLDNTWELCQPNASPWINAKEFGNYWRTRTKPEAYTVNYILDHPDEIFNKTFYPGDVVQIAVNLLGIVGESQHTMYITGYDTYNGQENYTLTYHSYSKIDRHLLQICQEFKDKGKNPYIVFFSM